MNTALFQLVSYAFLFPAAWSIYLQPPPNSSQILQLPSSHSNFPAKTNTTTTTNLNAKTYVECNGPIDINAAHCVNARRYVTFDSGEWVFKQRPYTGEGGERGSGGGPGGDEDLYVPLPWRLIGDKCECCSFCLVTIDFHIFDVRRGWDDNSILGF